MKNLKEHLLVCFFLVLSLSCTNEYSSHPEIVGITELEKRMKSSDAGIEVYNFWATWCAPCVKELPYFERINEEFKEEGLEMNLVSIDFLDDLEGKLVPFLGKQKLKSDVLLLNAGKPKHWIDRVDKRWSGSIPLTIIVKGNNRYFYEQEFEYEELKEIIDSLI